METCLALVANSKIVVTLRKTIGIGVDFCFLQGGSILNLVAAVARPYPFLKYFVDLDVVEIVVVFESMIGAAQDLLFA